MRRELLFFITIVLIIIYFYHIEEGMSNSIDQNEYFQRLMTEYNTIFPDRNRNGGGVQYYHHIITNMNPTIEEFNLYNTFYCGVSGSPIDPNRSQIYDYLVVNDLDDNLMYGKYYRCCSPCVCDIMKYVKTEEYNVTLSDGDHPHYVLTIDDPCSNENEIPDQVTSFQCENNNTINGIKANSGRLIIAVLFDVQPYDENNSEMNSIYHQNETMCEERNSQSPDQLRGGMGDIFVRLSLIGNDNIEPFNNNELLNIYGEPLQKCQILSNDTNGSWDNEGYCSEVGGGVHQICFDVKDSTKDFAEDTNQGSNWSLNRLNKNHCMCIGAWALYKAKQDQNMINRTLNELKCESIPEMSLTERYLDNWNTWNGNELPNQIVNGVNYLFDQCYHEGNNEQKQYLLNKYTDFTQTRPEFHNTEIYLFAQSER